MGAIVLDASKVNSYVLPNLVKSKNPIQDAYSTSQSLRNSLPSSFTYRSTINDIVNQLYNIKREISDIDTMISKKVEKAKTIENRNDNRASGIAKAASSIGSIVGTIGGAAMGAATGGVVGTVAGAAVGKKIGSGVGKALVNTGAKVVEKFTSLSKIIGSEIKKLPSTIAKIYKKTDSMLNKIGSFINNKVLKKMMSNPVGKFILRTGATCVNLYMSFCEGFYSFIESLFDFVILVSGVTYTPITFLTDLGVGIISGDWSFPSTGCLWKKIIMPVVGIDFVGTAYDTLYEGEIKIGNITIDNTNNNNYKIFSEVNKYAYKWGKRGEIGCDISKGVGHITGIVLLTIATCGIGSLASGATSVTASAASSAAASTTTSLASILNSTSATWISTILAGAAKTGQSAQKSYNSLSDEEKQSGKSIGKVVGSSFIKGGIESAVWFVTYGKGANMLANSKSKIVSKLGLKRVGQILKGKSTILNNSKVLSKLNLTAIELPKLTAATTKGVIQGGKEFGNAFADSIMTGEFDLDETIKKAAVSGATSITYDYSVGTLLSNIKVSTDNSKEFVKSVPTDNALSGISKGSVQSSSISKFTEFMSKGSSLMDELQSSGGKKIIGKGIKELIKNNENKIYDRIVNYVKTILNPS